MERMRRGVVSTTGGLGLDAPPSAVVQRLQSRIIGNREPELALDVRVERVGHNPAEIAARAVPLDLPIDGAPRKDDYDRTALRLEL